MTWHDTKVKGKFQSDIERDEDFPGPIEQHSERPRAKMSLAFYNELEKEKY